MKTLTQWVVGIKTPSNLENEVDTNFESLSKMIGIY
jgi:hypothetical protein